MDCQKRVVSSVLVCAILLAGCAGQPSTTATVKTTTGTPTTPPTATETTQQPSLSFNSTVTYERVEDLLTTDETSRPTVSIQRPTDRSPKRFAPTTLRYRLGILTRGGHASNLSTVASGSANPRTIRLIVGEHAPSGRVERALAHEYAHTILWEEGYDYNRSGVPRAYRGTADAGLARFTISEGVPTWVADRYATRYLPNTPTATADLREAYRQASPGRRLFVANYYVGARYVAWRLETGSLRDLHENPPYTTEQVLHRSLPSEEPPRALAVESNVSGFEREDATTRGELFLRVALSAELPLSTAERAAAGWGMDRSVTLTNGTATAHAWVIRFDTVGEADEFADVLEEYVAARNAAVDDTRLRWTRVAPETIVLFAGPPAFVRTVTATGTNESVTVTG